MLFVCVAGLTDEIQELVTKTIRSPPINSGTDYNVFFLLLFFLRQQCNNIHKRLSEIFKCLHKAEDILLFCV